MVILETGLLMFCAFASSVLRLVHSGRDFVEAQDDLPGNGPLHHPVAVSRWRQHWTSGGTNNICSIRVPSQQQRGDIYSRRQKREGQPEHGVDSITVLQCQQIPSCGKWVDLLEVLEPLAW